MKEMIAAALISLLSAAEALGGESRQIRVQRREPACSVSQPYDSVGDATVAGKQRYEQFRSTGSTKPGALVNAAATFLDAIFRQGVALQVKAAIDALHPKVEEDLTWTGKNGGVIDVVFEVDAAGLQPATLLGVEYLGSGRCPYDVVVEAKSEDRLEPQPKPGYKVDNDASLLLWVERTPNGYVDKPVAPGFRGPILAKAIGDAEARRFMRESSRVREYDQLRGIVTQLTKLEEDAATRRQIQEALEARKRALDEQVAIEKRLQAALLEQKRLADTSAWIDDVGKALTLGQLAVQVKDLLGPNPQAPLRDAVSQATSPEDLGQRIKRLESSSAQSIRIIEGERTVLYEKIEIYRKTIIDSAKRKGAPDSALRLPRP